MRREFKHNAQKNWIQGAMKPSMKGALHMQLHIPKGVKIPGKLLNKAAHSSNPLLKKRAILAKTLKGFHSK